LTVERFGGRLLVMLRKKKNKQDDSAQAPAPAAQPASNYSGGYVRSQLTTFDGKGNPSVIEYSTDSVGRTVKRRMGGRGKSH